MKPSASAISWLPEDDLLLKNAVEKGATLESLAKGAVQFSRRFTIQELRDRWHALLYDPDVSAKASANMIEQECSKLTRLGVLKEKQGVPAKRKSESVRSCYHALLKKMRSQPFSSMDLGFILTPSNGDDSLVCDSMVGDPISDQLRPQVLNLDINHQDFPNPLTDRVSVIGHVDTANDFSDGLHDTVRAFCPTHIEELPKNMSGIVGENFAIAGNRSAAEEHSELRDFSVSNIFKTDDPVEPSSTLGKIYSDTDKFCSEDEKNQLFNSPTSDCNATLCNLEYSSTSEKQVWGTVDKDSVQAFSVDVSIRNNDLHFRDGYANGDINIKHANTSEYKNSSTEKVENEATLNADASTQHYLAELSVSLLNFSDEEEFLFTDADGKEIDKSYYDGLSSLLLNSPEDDNQQPLPDTSELEKSIVCDPLFVEPSNIYDGEITNMAPDIRIELEIHDSTFCCTLNTEDSDIPCNDDVFLPGSQKIAERGPIHMQKEHNYQKPSPVCSQMTGPKITAEVGQFNQAGIALGVSNRLSLTNYRVDNSLAGKPKEEAEDVTERMEITDELPVVGIPSHDPNVYRSSLGGVNQEVGTSSEPAVNHPTPDAEEPIIESDDDLPYFSDIEAMILDMDLVSYDQDLSQSAEVLKYQQEDTKRTIIRLEQGANVNMQRSIASHGAFAVLYGRHSKHYIKKPEVMLGRATDEVNVDIDLGREGCANKISRQQAVIRLGGDGYFYLNNLGKCLVSSNGNNIAPGQGLKLHSGCLIEVRGIPFIFETNQTRVKQYLDSVFQEIEA